MRYSILILFILSLAFSSWTYGRNSSVPFEATKCKWAFPICCIQEIDIRIEHLSLIRPNFPISKLQNFPIGNQIFFPFHFPLLIYQ
jgi:hypothetical protein